jgi:hypothetical protein
VEAHTSRSWDEARPRGPDPLFGAEAARALDAVADERDALRRAARLRELLPPGLATRAAQLADLRIRMARSYPARTPSFATPGGLAMATREDVAMLRAREIAQAFEGGWALDATCGIGVEVLALSAEALRVVAADRDPYSARCTAANLALHGFPVRVLVADALRPALRPDVLVLDPERRVDGRRTLDPESWSPGLQQALRLARGVRGACLKLAPALDVDRLPLGQGAWRWRWVSSGRELVEVTLLGGELARADPGRRPPREVLARVDGHEVRFEAEPEEVAPWAPGALEGLPWLAEPDPALIRSGLLGALARREGLRPLDARIAYLAGEVRPTSPLLVAWRVVESVALDRKRVRAMLDRHDVGPVEVHKRGQAEPAEVLARRLAGRGSRRGVLFVVRLDSGHRAFLVQAAGPLEGPQGPLEGVGDEGFEPPTSSL